MGTTETGHPSGLSGAFAVPATLRLCPILPPALCQAFMRWPPHRSAQDVCLSDLSSPITLSTTPCSRPGRALPSAVGRPGVALGFGVHVQLLACLLVGLMPAVPLKYRLPEGPSASAQQLPRNLRLGGGRPGTAFDVTQHLGEGLRGALAPSHPNSLKQMGSQQLWLSQGEQQAVAAG